MNAMKLICELSKEHPRLPKAELYACLQAENIDYSLLEQHQNIITLETSASETQIQPLFTRPALTFYIYEYLFSCPPDIEIVQQHLKTTKNIPKGSISITKKNTTKTSNTQPIINLIQTYYTQKRNVDLTNPENQIHIHFTNDNLYVGRLLTTLDRKQYEQRKVQYRPFFSPISLHPKWARTLVNLSLIQKNQTLLDPFCGTGGILLEAGFLGAKIIGSDIEKKMITGCEQCLVHYGIKNYTVFSSDISDITKTIKNVDAVVTDFPYGHAATTKKEDTSLLYNRAFKTIADVLKNKGRAVIGLSDNKKIALGEKYLLLQEIYEFRVHKSLTRYFCIFQK